MELIILTRSLGLNYERGRVVESILKALQAATTRPRIKSLDVGVDFTQGGKPGQYTYVIRFPYQSQVILHSLRF